MKVSLVVAALIVVAATAQCRLAGALPTSMDECKHSVAVDMDATLAWVHRGQIDGPATVDLKRGFFMEVNNEEVRTNVAKLTTKRNMKLDTSSTTSMTFEKVLSKTKTFSAHYGVIHESFREQSTTTSTKATFRVDKRTDVRVTVPAGQSRHIWELVLAFPGGTATVAQSVLASDKPRPTTNIDELVLRFQVRPEIFVEHIDVVHCDSAADRPVNAVPEVDGWNDDLNRHFGGKFVYLVVRTTADRHRAATGIRFWRQGSGDNRFVDIAKGAGGDYRYVQTTRVPGSRLIRPTVRLWRTKKGKSKPSKRGYAYSDNINGGRGKDYLYVCWKHTDVTAV